MSGKKIEILCIDDDQDDFEIFGEALTQTGLDTNVQNAMTDVDLFRYFSTSTVPDIIFLDGSVTCHYENNCLEEIKAQKHLEKIPVIILSTVGGDYKVNDMYKRGAVLFLIKPSTLNELSDLLKVALTIDWRIADLEKIKDEFSSRYPEMKFPKAVTVS